MKELIERLRNDCYQEDEVRAHAKEAAAALERLMSEQVFTDLILKAANETVASLTAERDSLKEGLDGWHARYLDMEVERDAGLKYTAWQSPHNDDLWLENPADCDIIDNFHPPVHVGFEYELTAGSYTTQRYRVVKIADAESDDVLVELIAGEKT